MRNKHLEEALRAHTNLTVFAAVVSILEGGSVYGGVGSDPAAQAIIARAQREQARLLRKLDAATDNLADNGGGENV